MVRSVSGKTIVEHINKSRIDLAKEMLRTTEAKLSEIAERCGFDDEKYFSRVFKKYCDISPGKYRIIIDLKPALDRKTLDRRLISDFEKGKNKNFINALSELLPSKMIPVFVKLSGILPERKVNSITKDERTRLVSLLKSFELTVKSPRPIDEAIVTSGGIDVREINPKTMESKLIHGLFFAGEIIDVDAYTGGFNLQIAWSTGKLAGLSAAK